MNLSHLLKVFLTACMLVASAAHAESQADVSMKSSLDKSMVQFEAKPLMLAMADEEERELDEDGFPIPKQKKKLAEAPPAPADAMSPLERVKSAPVGTLKNPYKHDLNNMAPFGKQRYFGNSCNGCHGGTGGGGMCPPLSNATWVYGKDDDTLFRLIALGSDELQKQLGITRKGRENVVGPMPPFGGIIKTDDEIWRIISYIRTIYNDDPKNDPRNVH